MALTTVRYHVAKRPACARHVVRCRYELQQAISPGDLHLSSDTSCFLFCFKKFQGMFGIKSDMDLDH